MKSIVPVSRPNLPNSSWQVLQIKEKVRNTQILTHTQDLPGAVLQTWSGDEHEIFFLMHLKFIALKGVGVVGHVYICSYVYIFIFVIYFLTNKITYFPGHEFLGLGVVGPE